MVKLRNIIIAVTAIFLVAPVNALTYTISPYSNIVGKIQTVTVQKGDTMAKIAEKYDIGMLEMKEANPSVNPNKLKAGTKLIIPSEFVLPPGPRTGMVINLAELRVYYYSPDGNTVSTYPIGIGQVGWKTPIGETSIVRKRKNPTWTPPASIHAEAASRGYSLPSVVPAGPNNPLGRYALNLGWNGYLMHGTNAPHTVGLRSSHGCMRMYANDVESLYNTVEIGTPVRVIYEPFKVGFKNGGIYLEAHELFPEEYYNNDHDGKFDLLTQTVTEADYPGSSDINWAEAKQLIKETLGYPVEISGRNSI